MDARRSGNKLRQGWQASTGFAAFATRVATWAGQPAAFVTALSSIVIWLASGRAFGWSDTWQLVVNTATTIVTFLMVFLIQNSQNRDAAAMQAKLDELIRAMRSARNDFIGIEHLMDAQIELIRADLEAQFATNTPGHRRIDSVHRLLDRR